MRGPIHLSPKLREVLDNMRSRAGTCSGEYSCLGRFCDGRSGEYSCLGRFCDGHSCGGPTVNAVLKRERTVRIEAFTVDACTKCGDQHGFSVSFARTDNKIRRPSKLRFHACKRVKDGTYVSAKFKTDVSGVVPAFWDALVKPE